MAESEITCNLRQHRTEARLSQNDLAERVGISRQAIIAIEAGRQVPSTAIALQLARALRCSVEDLFVVERGARIFAWLAPSPQASTRVAMGLVDDRWVAHPVTTGDHPVDGLLVRRRPGASTVNVEPLSERSNLEHNVLVAGCAPLLGVLAGTVSRRYDDARATWLAANSTRAMELLAEGLVHVAGLHLVDTQTPGGHSAIVRAHFSSQTMTIVNLARWRQGLVVAKENPLGIRGVGDLCRPEVRFARRDSGAGAQKLVERLLAERGIDSDAIACGPTASGHAEIARWVRQGFADVGVAVEAAALVEGLGFIPLAEERFDLVVPQSRLAARPVGRLFDLIENSAFLADANELAGYDLSTAGHASTVATH